MMEDEWRTSHQIGAMLEQVRWRISDRKMRLFAVVCCRQVRDHLWTTASWAGVQAAERFADGLTGHWELQAAQRDIESRLELHPGEPVYDAAYWASSLGLVEDIDSCCFYAANCSTRAVSYGNPEYDLRSNMVRGETLRLQADALREVVGSPFRVAVVRPEWRTSTVVTLAAQMYESDDFAAFPIIADALEEAGCDDAEVLAHCRGDGPHVRGCWVIDRLTGRG